MLSTMSVSEYVDWIAYFSVDWDNFKPDQSPQQMQTNMSLIKAVTKKTKAKKRK